ncbi:MAG: malto-oligosyltrehalose trehalohydrolase [Verrucomicrobiales bacterium]
MTSIVDTALQLGTNYLNNGQCSFRVWAMLPKKIELHIVSPEDKIIPMQRDEFGYATVTLPQIAPGTKYFYRIDGEDRPDPASRYQPEGVHGPSEVISQDFPWTDGAWHGIPLKDYIIYELHVGTFSKEGTFEGIIPFLPELKSLGITAIEIMPIAQFPGGRNWGYDGVGLFAAQNTYGGPLGFKKLVDACHQHGMAVVLDVVYNHLGPEGNYLPLYGKYFSDLYKTPWGPALNFDGPHSDPVRQFFIENALYWQIHFHVDALRLDAVHGIRDFSTKSFLHELAESTGEASENQPRNFYLIAENDTNNPRFINPPHVGGFGLHAQWSDDFHHSLHRLLTKEERGYYSDFNGVAQFAKIWREGFAYTGEYAPHRKQRHGGPTLFNHPKQFVICAQNHDQVGNRPMGDRLISLTDFERAKVAAAAVILSPFIPLLFMGEEYGESAPFQYFISHTDADLVKAVQKGRAEEFKDFFANGTAPDPFSMETFSGSKLNHELKLNGPHKSLYSWYKHLLKVRKNSKVIRNAEKGAISTQTYQDLEFLAVRFHSTSEETLLAFSFNEKEITVKFDLPPGNWLKIVDSSAPEWEGKGSPLPRNISSTGSATVKMPPYSAVMFERV